MAIPVEANNGSRTPRLTPYRASLAVASGGTSSRRLPQDVRADATPESAGPKTPRAAVCFASSSSFVDSDITEEASAPQQPAIRSHRHSVSSVGPGGRALRGGLLTRLSAEEMPLATDLYVPLQDYLPEKYRRWLTERQPQQQSSPSPHPASEEEGGSQPSRGPRSSSKHSCHTKWVKMSPRNRESIISQRTSREIESFDGLTLREKADIMENTRRFHTKMPVLQHFKRSMVKQCGTLKLAWQALDVESVGSLEFREFVAACRRIKYSGNLKQIFEELTNGEQALRPEMLDDDLAEAFEKATEHRNAREAPSWSSEAVTKLATSRRGEKAHPDYVHGKRTVAETMGEVGLLLTRPPARAPPPTTARNFKAALLKKFETLDHAWTQLDLKGVGSLNYDEFVHACLRIQFSGCLKQIFADLTQGKDTLTPQALSKALSSRLKERSSATRPRKPPPDASHFNHGRKTVAETMGEIAVLFDREGTFDPRRSHQEPLDVRGFRAALLQRYGSAEHAWYAMDRKGAGVVCFADFAAVCRSLGLRGPLKKVFEELTGAVDERLLPDHLDSGLAQRLATQKQELPASAPSSVAQSSMRSDARGFKSVLLKKYDYRLDRAWKDLDLNGDGAVQFHEFVLACRRLSIGGCLHKLFDDITGGEKELRPEALDPSLPALLGTTSSESPAEAVVSPHRRSEAAAVALAAAQKELPASPHESFGKSPRWSWRTVEAASNAKPHVANAADFKRALLSKYGSLEHAWQDIDTNGDGHLQFSEFEAACNRLRFACNHRRVFQELAGVAADGFDRDVVVPSKLDPQLPSRIKSLRAKQANIAGPMFHHGRKICAETAGEVAWTLDHPSIEAPLATTAKAFKAALVKKYGNLQCAWDEIDSNGDGALQFHEFIKGCRRIQFVGNLHKIFNELAVDGEFHMEDLDPVLRRAKAQSEEDGLRARVDRQKREQERQAYLRENLKMMSRDEVKEHNAEWSHSLFKDFLVALPRTPEDG
eukprot:TRINITY_DN34517_c0_g2_i1.p1 TRINITY_DN34517_c0_g2~~TRINITY_DN34517_c0_g2_i1.p1  ORF type:complete len:1013 (-),score=190.50 TRINITY_DN34517_c0_g2_i1:34-3018(-)